MVTDFSQLLGTVYFRFAPDSQVTEPLVSTLKNLYSKFVPGGRLTLPDHSGFEEVYLEAERGIAEPVFQLPSWAIDPESLIV
jgi:hypothetical protein